MARTSAVPQPSAEPTKILDIDNVIATTTLSRSELYRQMAAEEHPFPRPIQLVGKRRVWLASEVHEWIAARITKARGAR